jgi:hypothetical protein
LASIDDEREGAMDPIVRREMEQWKRRRAKEKGTERHGCLDDKNEEIRTSQKKGKKKLVTEQDHD